MPDNPYVLEGFTLIRHDRIGKGGGGVALYIHDCYRCKLLKSFDPQYNNSPAFLIVEINYSSVTLLIAVVYRPPKAAYPSELFDSLSNLLP